MARRHTALYRISIYYLRIILYLYQVLLKYPLLSANEFPSYLKYDIINIMNIRLRLIILAALLLVYSACDDSSKATRKNDSGTTEEKNILSETNKVRTNPQGYADMLKTEMAGITDASTKSTYQSAITTLENTTPRNPLKFEQGLYQAARLHAEDLIKSNTFSHTGSNGSTFTERIDLFGSSYTTAGENIACGTNQNTGAKVVKQWVLSPGHLGNILNPNFSQLGAALMQGHPTYNWVAVQVFANGFVAK